MFLSACLENTSSILEQEITTQNENIAITVSDVNVTETNSGYYTFELEIVFSEPLVANANLSITSIDGTARSGKDFVAVSERISAPKGARSIKIPNVQIIGENIYENNESFYIKATTDSTFSFADSKNVGTVTIINDDLPPKLSIKDATAKELNKLVFKVEADVQAEVDILIDYVTLDLSDAIPAVDYDSSSGQVVLKSETSVVEIQIFAPYDELNEDEEVFGVSVSSPNSDVIFTDNSAIGTIVDNNGLPFVSFSQSSVEYYETQGTALITLELDQISGKDVVVPLTVTTNELNSDEYSGLPTSITIPEGSLSKTVSFNLYDDENMEASEKLVLEIDSSIEDANRGTNKTFSITIAESDGLPENLSNLVEKGIGFHIDGSFYKDQIMLRPIGDIDNDGKDDLMAYNDYGVTPNNQKRSYLFYGRDRYTENFVLSPSIETVDIDYLSTTSGASYGSNYFQLPDINCDGIDDYMYIYNYNTTYYYMAGTQGRFNAGDDLSLFLTRYNTPNLNSAYKNVGDINGDGCDDISTTHTSYEVDSSEDVIEEEGRLFFAYNDGTSYSGTTNPSVNSSTADFTITGHKDKEQVGKNYSASKIGDINGDGYDDLFYGNRFSQASILPGKETQYTSFTTDDLGAQGGAIISSRFYATGTPLHVPSSKYTADVNFDGYEDIIIYARAARQLMILPGKSSLYADYNYYGTNPSSYNAQIYEFYTSSGMLEVFDFNGDGYLDVLFGVASDDRNGGPRLSSIFVKWGSPYVAGTITMDDDYDHKILGEFQGWYLNSMDSADINGDGIFDLILNYSNAYTSQLESGRSYVIYGGNLTDAMDIIGTNANDTLTGTSSAEVIFGGKGDDNIIGGGGADYIQGASGDDSIQISDYDFRAIDGGPGKDFVALKSYNLDLSAGTVAKFRNIEGFDLKSSSTAETLSIGRAAVNKLNKTKKLYIKGSVNDTVNIVDTTGTWSSNGTTTVDSVNYTIYESTKTRAVVYIESGVNVGLP